MNHSEWMRLGIKELRKLADRERASREEDRLRDCAEEYITLQIMKRGDECLTSIVQRAAEGLLLIGILPEGVQSRLRDQLPKGRKARRG